MASSPMMGANGERDVVSIGRNRNLVSVAGV
jgi:hypothetical protein